MNDNTVEQAIQAKGLTAPRVTPADVEANIIGEAYFTAEQGRAEAARAGDCHEIGWFSDPGSHNPLQLLTFCVLVLKNGFTVTGESACVSPENFDAEIGRKIARQNAVAKVWPLMGYELKQRQYREALGDTNQYAEEQLAWHGQLRNDLMGELGLDDPADILQTVREMKRRYGEAQGIVSRHSPGQAASLTGSVAQRAGE
jgi:hypothetical protein